MKVPTRWYLSLYHTHTHTITHPHTSSLLSSHSPSTPSSSPLLPPFRPFHPFSPMPQITEMKKFLERLTNSITLQVATTESLHFSLLSKYSVEETSKYLEVPSLLHYFSFPFVLTSRHSSTLSHIISLSPMKLPSFLWHLKIWLRSFSLL